MEYSKEITDELEKKGVKIGDSIIVEKDVHKFEGVLMPKSQGAPESLIIKLASGYNTGIVFENGVKIRKSGSGEEKFGRRNFQHEKHSHDPGKPTIAILSTGGTIASRIDYRTGGVHTLETPEEILSAIPELRDIANIKMRQVFQMWSEDMEAYHWITLAQKIEDEIKTGVDGIIITHGTDAMHYTSAALSLMVQNSPIPILLVGSQRSTDRGSSDASMNLLCAVQFIANSGFSGVAICMHASTNDDFCHIHQGTHVKKMHTSRRDAFKSVDVLPYAKAYSNGTVEFLRNDYIKKDMQRKPHMAERFDSRVALVKIYPGFDSKILEFYESAGYRGLVLEMFALGHAPVNVFDETTKSHENLLETIRKLSKSIIIGAVSQCTYGKVNMSVYSTGRILQDAGVIELSMTSEMALVKMGWSLGHTKDIEDAKKILTTNTVGEILDRVAPQAYE